MGFVLFRNGMMRQVSVEHIRYMEEYLAQLFFQQ